MSKPFGQDIIALNQLFLMQDVVAKAQHRKPEHRLCKPRSVEVVNGLVYVKVAFHGPNDTRHPEQVDADGYALEGTCSVFPSMLRLP